MRPDCPEFPLYESSERRLIKKLSPLGLVLSLIVCFQHAHAAACLDAVNEISERYDLASDPPDAQTGGVSVDELSRSQGVIDPPPVGDRDALITPPPGRTGGMDTAPRLDTDEESGVAGSSPSLQPEEQARIGALLTAARRYAESGDEERCRERMQEVEKLLERPRSSHLP